MIQDYNYTQDNLALVIGKAQSTVAEILALNKLTDKIKDEVRYSDKYSRRVLVEVAKQKTPKRMNALFKKIKASSLNGTEIRKIVRNHRLQTDIVLNRIDFLTKLLEQFNFSSLEEDKKKLS
jgi:ParB family chromosome partitioning protein